MVLDSFELSVIFEFDIYKCIVRVFYYFEFRDMVEDWIMFFGFGVRLELINVVDSEIIYKVRLMV